MSARDLAALEVENGASIRQAAKNHGLKFHQLYHHIALIRRHSSLAAVSTPKETLISAAMEAVKTKRLTKHGAARMYGIPTSTLSDRLKNRKPERGRPTKFSMEEEAVLVDIMQKLAKLNIGLTKQALIKMLATMGKLKGSVYSK